MLDLKRIEELLDRLRQIDLNEIYVFGQVSPDEIEAVESELGIDFCEDYRHFLAYFGNLWLAGEDLVGLIPNDGPDCGSDLRYQTRNFRQSIGIDPGNRTVLVNTDDEWYELVDHGDGKVYAYDPFAKKFHERFQNLEEAILQKIGEAIEVVKAS